MTLELHWFMEALISWLIGKLVNKLPFHSFAMKLITNGCTNEVMVNGNDISTMSHSGIKPLHHWFMKRLKHSKQLVSNQPQRSLDGRTDTLVNTELGNANARQGVTIQQGFSVLY